MNQLNPEFLPQNNVDLTLIEKIKDVHSLAKIDYGNTGTAGKATLLALGGMTMYEWGPGNEALTPIIGAQALEMSDGLRGIALTAGITGLFTFGQQLSSSWLTRKSVQQFPSVANKSYEYMNGDDTLNNDLKYKPFGDLPLSKKGLYPFAVGTSFVVSREAFITGSTDEEDLKKLGRKSAAITAGGVAIIASTVDVLDQAIPDNWSVLKGIVNFFKTPIPYVGAVAGVLANDYIKTRKNRKLSKVNEQ